MKFTWSGVVITKFPPLRQDTSSSDRRMRLSTVALAWAMVNFASFHRRQVHNLAPSGCLLITLR